MRPSPETLDELKQLAEAATPGPHSTTDMVLGGWQTIEDGEYHALAINTLPSLLAYIRDLEAVAEAARATRYWGGVGSMLDAALAALDNPGETGETG